MEEKYIKLGWPEYQTYMEHPNFRELSGYDAEEDVYYVPEDLISEVDAQNIPSEIEFEGNMYTTERDYKKGDEVLFEDEDLNMWTSICTAKGGYGLPSLFEPTHGKVPGINCWPIGVRINENK